MADSDFHIADHGSIILFQPLSDEAQAWIDDNVAGEPQWWAGALVVERRYAADLLTGIRTAGLHAVVL